MTTYTIYAAAGDGDVRYFGSTDWADARAGGGTLNVGASGATITPGSRWDGSTFNVGQGFLPFDTSGVAGDIESATLSLYGTFVLGTTSFSVQARAHTWTDPLDATAFVAGDDLSGLTLLAQKAIGSLATGTYNDLTSEAAFTGAINQSGTTRIMLHDTLALNNTTPVDDSRFAFSATDTTGTTQDPKLTIVAVQNINLAIPSTAITLTAQAPKAATDTLVRSPAASFTLTGRAPTIQTTDGQVQVDGTSLTLTAHAPSLFIDRYLSIPQTSMTLASQTPTVSVLATLLDIPSTRMTLTAIAPVAAGALWNPTIPANTIWTPVPLAD